MQPADQAFVLFFFLFFALSFLSWFLVNLVREELRSGNRRSGRRLRQL